MIISYNEGFLPALDKWDSVHEQCSEFLLNPGEPSTKPIEWCVSIIEDYRLIRAELSRIVKTNL